MRSFVLACVVSAAGVSACSFILDTDSLKNSAASSDAGTGTPDASGAGGAANSDASTVDAGPTCLADFDCQGPSLDSCNVNKCGADHTCAKPTPYHGLAITPEGALESVLTADDIGYPTLIADNTSFYLGVWTQTAAASNIEIRKFPEVPSTGGAKTDLNALLPGLFEQYGSSPGMAVVGLAGFRLRLLFAGDPIGMPPMGMHLIDIDETPLQLAPPAQQPKVDPAVVGYDTKPRGPVPRLLTSDWGLWVQNEKLIFFDGKNPVAAPAFGAKRVLGFAPMVGLFGPYAVLETAPLVGQGNEATELWALGNMAGLASLTGDEAGTRRGVTVAPFPEAYVNIVSWAFEGQKGHSLKTNVAACLGMVCQAVGAVDGAESLDNVPGAFPEGCSAKVSTSERDFAESFQITLANPDKPAVATTALLGSVLRVKSLADAGADAGTLETTTLNPSGFAIATAEGPVSTAAGEILGPTSIAMTANDHIMVAWVERAAQGQAHVLKTRRFVVKTCP